jgi:hypothetical protein
MFVFRNFGLLSGWAKFCLIWCGAWFLLEALTVVMNHSGWDVVMMLVFAALFLWNYALAQKELVRKLEYVKANDR